MVVLDATIANIALPFIGKDLDISRRTCTWIVTGYSLAFGGLLLLGGRLGDLYGRRRIFMVGLVDLRRRLAARRPRPERGAAARRPGPPGPRRRARLARRAGADHHDLPGRPAAQPRVRGVRRDVRRRRGRRPDPRRLADRPRARRCFGTDVDGWRLTFLINVPIGLVAALLAPRLLGESRSRTPASSTSPAPSPAPLGLLGIVYGLTRAGNAAYGWGDTWTIASPGRRRRSCSAALRADRVAGSSTRCCRSGSSPTAPGRRASWR